MKKVVVFLAGVLSVFAAATTVASACLLFGYEPKMPKSLK